jgi:2-polyprenyl-6-methoxyphenol hydroxylase-like FAD-dependent oxidoreductase
MKIQTAGGGIAGLALAAFLSRAGHEVVVYDKAPAPAPVGSGLIVQPTGQAVLAELGLLGALKRRAARLDRLDGRTPDGKRKVLDVRYDALGTDVFGLSTHRAVLFDLLIEGARAAGARIEHGREVEGVTSDPEQPQLVFVGGEKSEPADLVIDALGVRSPFVDRSDKLLRFGALWANAPLPDGFDPHELAQRYKGADTSTGVMPIGSLEPGGPPLAAFFWTLRADRYEAWRESPLDDWKRDALQLWPALASVVENFQHHDDFVFARYAHHTRRDVIEGRVLHIGDAWRCASPQLGQGANMALLDAFALNAAMASTNDIDEALQRFVTARRSHVRLYQLVSFLFTPVYQSDAKVLPVLRDVLAEPLSNFWFMPKVLAALVSGLVGEPVELVSRIK